MAIIAWSEGQATTGRLRSAAATLALALVLVALTSFLMAEARVGPFGARPANSTTTPNECRPIGAHGQLPSGCEDSSGRTVPVGND